MKRAHKLVGSLVFAALLSPVPAQEADFPRTVVYEAVVADLTFRTSSDPRVESGLVVINSEADPVLLELELWRADGSPAGEFFEQRAPTGQGGFVTWASRSIVSYSPETQRFYGVIPAHSVRQLDFPGLRNPLVGQDFSGWAVLRANRPVAIFQTTQLTLGPPFDDESEVRRTASLGRTISGDLWATVSRSEVFRIGVGRVGSVIGETGISLVNPHDIQTQVRLERAGRNRTLTIAPRARTTFNASELFPRQNEDEGSVEELRIVTEEGPGFAAAAVDFRYFVDLNGRLMSPGETPALEFREAQRLRLPVQSSYDFPEEALHQILLNGHLLTLTRFGLSIRSEGRDPSDQVFPLHVGENRSQLTGIATPPEADMALVYGSPHDPVAVVFASGRVEAGAWVECCTDPPEFERLEPHLVQVVMGHECYRLRLVIDTLQEVIVSRENFAEPGAFCF